MPATMSTATYGKALTSRERHYFPVAALVLANSSAGMSGWLIATVWTKQTRPWANTGARGGAASQRRQGYDSHLK